MNGADYSKELFAMLKSKTADLHDQVETMYPFVCLVSADIKVEEYKDALMLLKLLHLNCLSKSPVLHSKQVTEPILDKWVGVVDEFCGLIELDLNDLVGIFSLAKTENDPTSLECQSKAYSSISAEISIEHQLGALYVVLGSSLGAKFIFRHLQTVSSLSVYRHMYFSHSASGVDWRVFKQEVLDLVEKHNLTKAEIVKSAVNTFEHLKQMQISMFDASVLEPTRFHTELA